MFMKIERSAASDCSPRRVAEGGVHCAEEASADRRADSVNGGSEATKLL